LIFAGYPKAQNNLGLIYLDGRPGVPANIKLAHKYLGMAAEQKYQPGMHNFARCLLRDDNPERDAGKAFANFLAAAEQEFPPSMGEVGHRYELGIGVATDSAKALAWYAKGAEWGDSFSCQRYGQLLFDGTGVKQDRARGLAMLILGGDPIAIKAAREQADEQLRKQATELYKQMRDDLEARENGG
ncbi:MAG TPA: tetratricopeptide repeat protein, partial [Candidatus Ozemobacteraceae bacterium]|nr:tetratricopeptide repeat protein [Candidatus Ozemobacteraceae bacterium]